jgi:BASS family bile acid:Na+ symporter
MEAARQLLSVSVQASMFLMIMAVAMMSSWEAVGAQLRRPFLLLKGVVAVNVVTPAVAVAMVLILTLDRPVAQGLILMAISPLAPLVPGNAAKAGGRRSSIIALYTILIALAVVIVPVTVRIVNLIFGTHALAPAAVIAPIILVSAVLPILLGLTLAMIAPAFSRRAAPVLTLLSNIVLALFVLLILWVAGRQFLHMIGNGTILAFTVTVLAAIVSGHVLGGPERGDRATLALAAAIRHPGIAAAIAHANGASPQAMAAIILFLLNGVVVTSLYQLWLKRHPAAAQDMPRAAAGVSPDGHHPAL